MKSYPQTPIESLPLTEQIKEIHKNASIREITFSIKFRIILASFIYSLYLILSIYIQDIQIIIIFLSFMVLAYISILFSIIKNRNILSNEIGYIIPTLDTFAVFICLWIGSSFFNIYTYLDSINIILILIIILTSLQSNYAQTLYSSIIVSLFSLIYFTYCDPKRTIKSINPVNLILVHFDTISYSIYFLFGGIILSVKNYIRDYSIQNVRDLVIKKIVTKAHLKLLSSNGEHIEGNWSINSEIIHSEMLGADFISIKNNPNGTINVVIGDVTSHGLDVSPIAYACLSIFQGVQTDNPQVILTDMHKLVNKLGRKLSNGFLAVVFKLYPDGQIEYNGTLATPLIVTKSGKTINLLTKGFIVGKTNSPDTYKNKKIKLKKEDSVCINTDGYYNKTSADDVSMLQIKYLGEKYTN